MGAKVKLDWSERRVGGCNNQARSLLSMFSRWTVP
jgi:hypothetical protein